jgi:excisionase family DNA binding protein
MNDLDSIIDLLAERVAARVLERLNVQPASQPAPQPVARQWLDTDAAAEHLGMKSRTLVAWRERGRGPAYHRVGGRVRYRRDELDAFARSK